MKKKILFIISGLFLIVVIFCGGIYLGKEFVPSTGNQSDFYYYFSTGFIDGYGIIKEIDPNSSTITLSCQIVEDKTLEVKITEDSRFHQIIKWEEGKGIIESEPVELKDLKLNDKVYFVCQPNEDGSFSILWLNIKSK